MKNVNYVISGVLFVCVIILFVLHFTSQSKALSQGESGKTVPDSLQAAVLPIAYIKLDSLFTNYKYYNELNSILLKKSDDAQSKLVGSANQFKNEMEKFQKKVQDNAFISRESFENEQKSLARKQENLQRMERDLANELALEQQTLNEQLKDSINAFLKDYNAVKKYQLIFTGEIVLHGEEVYDITQDVVDGLNSRYAGNAEVAVPSVKK